MTNPSPKSVLKRYPAGSIFQGFGENPQDYAPIGYPGGHPGWDILAYEGAPIVACTSGTVISVATDPVRLGGIACWIVTPDNKIMHSYGHLQALLVNPGDDVTEGQQIGKMGNTGFIISGGTKFWGNAPAGRGVHCHINIVPLNPTTMEPINPNNGTRGSVDPTPFFTESIKPEIPNQIRLLQQLVELYRSLIRKLGGEPVA